MNTIKLPKCLYFDYLDVSREQNRTFPDLIKETKKNIYVEKVYNDALRSLYYEAWYWSQPHWSKPVGDPDQARYISAKYTVKAINKYFKHLTDLEDWNNFYDK
tara:strand:- start:64 stop:372 length:309 start_codon:yes stop_codon:yes gene_type:complete